MSKHPVVSFVNDLLFASGPIAIVGFVVAVVVNSFYAVLTGWTLPHVGKEILKHIPAFAHAYSTPAVVFIILVIFITAALSHRTPSVVRGRPSHSMSSFDLRSDFSMEAPAASSIMHETVINNVCLVPTIAQAVPIPSVFSDKRKAQDRQAAKPFTFQVVSFGDFLDIIVVSHLATPFSLVVRKARRCFRTVRLSLFYHNEGV